MRVLQLTEPFQATKMFNVKTQKKKRKLIEYCLLKRPVDDGTVKNWMVSLSSQWI